MRVKTWNIIQSAWMKALMFETQPNLNQQKQNQFVHVLYEHILAFQCAMRFWESQVRQGNVAHFLTLQERNPTIHGKYADPISDIIENFKDRFGDGGDHQMLFKIFSSSLEC